VPLLIESSVLAFRIFHSETSRFVFSLEGALSVRKQMFLLIFELLLFGKHKRLTECRQPLYSSSAQAETRRTLASAIKKKFRNTAAFGNDISMVQS
jgi:hypothetical protein